jgi:hypothetical protein
LGLAAPAAGLHTQQHRSNAVVLLVAAAGARQHMYTLHVFISAVVQLSMHKLKSWESVESAKYCDAEAEYAVWSGDVTLERPLQWELCSTTLNQGLHAVRCCFDYVHGVSILRSGGHLDAVSGSPGATAADPHIWSGVCRVRLATTCRGTLTYVGLLQLFYQQGSSVVH